MDYRITRGMPYRYAKIIERIDAEMAFFGDLDASRKQFVIRHDEDWDIGLSLALAKFEHGLGLRSVYFLNHTCEYFDYSSSFADKCRELQDLGHEVGLHQNVVEVFLETGQQVADILGPPLEFLRANGIAVRGVSSHGSRTCTQNRVVNFELWREFECSDFALIKASQRFNGELGLERVPLAEFGLEYDASLLSHEAYISDSSGRFWGVCRTREGEDRGRLYDLIEHVEMMRGATVVKSNPFEIIDYYNDCTDSGLLHLLLHPKWWEAA